MESEVFRMSESIIDIAQGDEFVEGLSPSMRCIEKAMLKVAQSEVPVLLLAEKGGGKRATARRIHELSPRRQGRFNSISCATFDCIRSSRGGGNDDLAGEGTIFLEEIANLSAQAQERLLRALTEENAKSGSAPGTARLICGSAKDLEAEVRAGNFREDLYYRISGVCLRLPPLRQRKEDIAVLMHHFLRKYGHDFQRNVPALSAETTRLFEEYSWPGNVRELENAAKAIVALGDEALAMGGLRAMLQRRDTPNQGGRVSLKQAARAASRETEKELILRTLTRTRWNRRRAAEELQISYKALLYKVKQIGCSECGTS